MPQVPQVPQVPQMPQVPQIPHTVPKKDQTIPEHVLTVRSVN